MRRLLHRLFRSHHYVPHELLLEPRPTEVDGVRMPDPDPYATKIWYVGYRCVCGERGGMIPIDV